MISFLSQLQISSYRINNPLAHTNGGTQEHTLHLSHPMGFSPGNLPNRRYYNYHKLSQVMYADLTLSNITKLALCACLHDIRDEGGS